MKIWIEGKPGEGKTTLSDTIVKLLMEHAPQYKIGQAHHGKDDAVEITRVDKVYSDDD